MRAGQAAAGDATEAGELRMKGEGIEQLVLTDAEGQQRTFDRVWCQYPAIESAERIWIHKDPAGILFEELGREAGRPNSEEHRLSGGAIMWRMALPVVLGLIASVSAVASDELMPAVRLEAAGKAIDTDNGHAAPFVCDFDGDAIQDLLVGQFGDGLLWIYRNEGTNAEPRLAAGVKFKDGEKDGRVPSG